MIFHALQNIWPDRRMLTPAALSVFLVEVRDEIHILNDSTKSALLDYLLSRPLDDDFDHLIGLPLIPTCDGGWNSLEYLSSLKLPIDDLELVLFGKGCQNTRTVDTTRLSTRAFAKLKVLQSHGMHGLQSWGIEAVYDFCMGSYFTEVADERSSIYVSGLDPFFPDFVESLWRWILLKSTSNDINTLTGLWIIPLVDNHYHKIAVGISSRVHIPLEPSGAFGGFVLSNKSYFSPFPIIDEQFNPDASSLLKSNMMVTDPTNLGQILQWIYCAGESIPKLSPDLKDLLCCHLAEIAACSIYEEAEARIYTQLIREFELWKEVSNTSTGTITNWIRLTGGIRYVAVANKTLTAVPETPNVVFLHAESSSNRTLMELFSLAETPDASKYMSLYVIPSLS